QHMVKHDIKGSILNTASIVAYLPGPWMAVYFATKAYVLSYSESLHQELKPYGISVTALCPGPTDSGFTKAGNLESAPFMQGKLAPSKDVAKFAIQAMKRK